MEQRTNHAGEPAFDPEDGSPLMAISCSATQACGGCPYTRELDKQDKDALGNPVYGMFGTDCWYRGKYGNSLLAEATDNDPMGDNLSFYGDEEDGSVKSVSSCIATADLCRLAWNSYEPEEAAAEETAEVIAGLKYAEWYLRWAAETTDGLICWY